MRNQMDSGNMNVFIHGFSRVDRHFAFSPDASS